MRQLFPVSVLVVAWGVMAIGCKRESANSALPIQAQNSSLPKPPNSKPLPLSGNSEEPYVPQEIAWQDIYLGMTEKEYLKCLRFKISSEPKNKWKNDGSIRTLDSKGYIRIEIHDHESKQDRVLDNAVPDRLFGELPSHQILLTDEPVTRQDCQERYDTADKSPLIQTAEATFLSGRLIVLRLEIKSSMVPKEEARIKFEQKYQRRFEPLQILTYRKPDQLITSTINCSILRKNQCSICINSGSTEFQEFNYYIQMQDDFRLRELQGKSKIKIAELRQRMEAARKAESDQIKF